MGFNRRKMEDQHRLAAEKEAAARRVFPRCWFNESTTEAGRDALGYYHERQDEKRSIGLGPEHDWSSHAADAFGYMAIAYEEPPVKSAAFRRPSPPRMGTHWSD
jgi:phage terminase large subunit